MTGRSWPAPAKLNLFLHVLGRRPDGYHRLQTVFQFISLADALHFELRDDGAVLRGAPLPGVPEEADLVLRAARRLQAEAAGSPGVCITVDKRIPLGGGLGGGSSDAATTLVALNHLWGLNLPSERLARIGLELGADVPVFVHGQAAWAESVGEVLEPVSPPEPWYLVVRPPCEVSTAEIFNAPELTRDTAPIKIPGFLSGRTHNDCEPVVRARYPAVAAALDWLNEIAPARLTGTGACLFAAFDSEADASAAAARLPEGCTGFVVKGLNRSPLIDRLALEQG